MSFVLKKFYISQSALTFQRYKCSVWLVDMGMPCNYNNVKINCKGENFPICGLSMVHASVIPCIGNMLQILSGQPHRKGICKKQDKEAAYSFYCRTICVSVHPGIYQHVNKRRF